MNNDKDKNLILYKASAGSGKTYTLVREFLTLCLNSPEKSYKEILAVTFTNKAANEMKAKILNNLEEIITQPVENSDMKKDLIKSTQLQENILVNRAKILYDNILHNYSDFNVSTIDGFVQQISRSFAKELNLPPQYMVLLDDDDLLDELIQRIDKIIGKNDDYLTEILSDFLEYQLDKEDEWRIDKPIREFIKKLLKENAYNKGEFINIKSLSNDEYKEIESYLDSKIESAKNNINVSIEEIEDIVNKYALTDNCFYQGIKGLPGLMIKITDKKKFDELNPSSLMSSYVRKIFGGQQNWFSSKAPKQTVNEINSNIDFVALYKKLVDDYNDLYVIDLIRKNLYLYALRAKFMEIINQYIEETNKVHISEFNKRISDVIGDCNVPFIYERIGSRFKHYFIDEFQDTSLLQWFNFLPLINNSLSENKMNLLVGDAKQAIYRFRSGEVEQIIQLPDIYKKPDNEFAQECEMAFNSNWNPKSLETNYRSKKNIVEFNNSFFDFSKNYLKNPQYVSVYQDNMKQKYRENLKYEGCVRVEIVKMDKLAENIKDDAKKETASTQYKNAVKKSMLEQINNLKTNDFSYKDITILVRNNSDGSDIADFLTQHNIPVVSADSILLKSSDKVLLIVLTMKYLCEENNPVNMLSMNYFYNICNNESENTLDLASIFQTEIDTESLKKLRNNAYSLYDLCVKLISFYGFTIIEDVFLQYFMNLVYEWQNNENDDVTAFLNYWDKKSNSFYVKITAEIDAVQIMSVHKSKGLEFKVVMYPYAFTKVPDRYHTAELWLSFENDFKALKDIPHIKNFLLPINKKLIGTKFEHYFNDEFDRAAFDDFNIMYVAMTRPEDILFIYTDDSQDNNSKSEIVNNFFIDYFNANSLSLKEDDVKMVYQLGEIRKITNDKSSDEEVLKLAHDDNARTLDWTEILKVDPDPTMFWADKEVYSPQEWGDLVHEVLSKINTLDDAQDVIRQYVNDGCIDDNKAAELYDKFEQITRLEEIKEAFSKDAKVRNEMEILTQDGIKRPDRYVELHDKVILIDYKTGKMDESYYEQLKDYVNVLKEMNVKKEIKAYLLYLKDEIELQQVFQDRLF